MVKQISFIAKIIGMVFIFNLFIYQAADAARVYILLTPSHEQFYTDWFLPTLPSDCELVITRMPQWCKSGEYQKSGWQKIMLAKVDLVIRAIEENWGNYFIFSDVDIQFFGEITPGIEELIKSHDLVIQRDSPPRKAYPKGLACAGFFACQGNENTLKLWKEVRACMTKCNVHDQKALAIILYGDPSLVPVSWCFLPNKYMSAGTYLGDGWKPNKPFPIAEDIVLHHANWTEGKSNKIRQLRMVRDAVKNRQLNLPTKNIIWKQPDALNSTESL